MRPQMLMSPLSVARESLKAKFVTFNTVDGGLAFEAFWVLWIILS